MAVLGSAMYSIQYMTSLQSFTLILVDFTYARHQIRSDFKMDESCEFAAELLLPATETPDIVSSLDLLEVGFEDEQGTRYETSQNERAHVTEKLQNLRDLGVLCVL